MPWTGWSGQAALRSLSHLVPGAARWTGRWYSHVLALTLSGTGEAMSHCLLRMSGAWGGMVVWSPSTWKIRLKSPGYSEDVGCRRLNDGRVSMALAVRVHLPATSFDLGNFSSLAV